MLNVVYMLSTLTASFNIRVLFIFFKKIQTPVTLNDPIKAQSIDQNYQKGNAT